MLTTGSGSGRVRCRIQNWSNHNIRDESMSQTEPNWLKLDWKSSTLPDSTTNSPAFKYSFHKERAALTLCLTHSGSPASLSMPHSPPASLTPCLIHSLFILCLTPSSLFYLTHPLPHCLIHFVSLINWYDHRKWSIKRVVDVEVVNAKKIPTMLLNVLHRMV